MATATGPESKPVFKRKSTETESQEVAVRRALDEITPEILGTASVFDEDALRELRTFDEAVALTTTHQGPVDTADAVLGDGFAVLSKEGKARLCGVPLLLMEWAFRPGDFGTPFVSVRLAARNPDGGMSRYIVNDGSTGIAEQLAKFTKKTGRMGGLLVKNGFRKSEYDYTDETGETRPAVTYYLDTSA